MKTTFLGKGVELPESSFPFTLTYVSVVTGLPVDRIKMQYRRIVELPRVDRRHGIVRTRIEWPDGRVTESDPPKVKTLPAHDDRMLTFSSEREALDAFSRCYLIDFFRPFGCAECERWHVYLHQFRMPLSREQVVVGVKPFPNEGTVFD